MAITDWQASYLHQGKINHLPTEADLDSALAADTSTTLLRHYAQTDADVNDVKVRNTVFFPPLIGILLERELYHLQAWDCLRGTIVTAGLVTGYNPFLYCLQAALVCSGNHTLSPLVSN